MSNQDVTKFEFLLTLEGKIICQRFFNVKEHNPQAKRCLDIHKYIKNICEEIAEDLKIKSSDFIYENREYYYAQEQIETNVLQDTEHYLLELKQGDDVFIQRIFPAFYYHPKVRYTVDIRPKLKRILSDLTDILSSEQLETKYLNHQL